MFKGPSRHPFICRCCPPAAGCWASHGGPPPRVKGAAGDDRRCQLGHGARPRAAEDPGGDRPAVPCGPGEALEASDLPETTGTRWQLKAWWRRPAGRAGFPATALWGHRAGRSRCIRGARGTRWLGTGVLTAAVTMPLLSSAVSANKASPRG